MMTQCNQPLTGRRRIFWATQIDANGTYEQCDRRECGIPGLVLVHKGDGATIETANYVAGLALNILLTDARKEDRECGYAPGNRGGHWSDSYTRAQTGSRLRQIPTTYSIRETVALVRANVQSDCQKLVTYGVAEKVETDVIYEGGNKITVTLSIHGRSGDVTRVGISGTRQLNSWAWNSTNVM